MDDPLNPVLFSGTDDKPHAAAVLTAGAAALGRPVNVFSTDKGSRTDIPKWVEKAGHRLVSLESRDGYDEIVVQKAR